MRKIRVMITVLTLIAVTLGQITAYAAPKIMSDGNIFDAEYYAENNEDVVAALGNSEDVLYNHYQNYGKKEGRAAYARGSSVQVPATNNSATGLAESLSNAFIANDYKTIQNYASKILSYSAELEPNKTADNGLTRMYNFPTSNGPLMITYYSGDEYNCIVNIALALHNSGDGVSITNEKINYQKRNESIHAQHGVPTCSNYVYGKNAFVLGDKWVSYVSCKNGYKYMEINTDGISYPSMKWYPDKANPAIFGQAKFMHYCTH